MLGGVVTEIVAGDYHVCALRADGRVLCAGTGTEGQLGDGELADKATPVMVGLEGVVDIAAHANTTCAVLGEAAGAELDGTAWCWGEGGGGQRGDATLLRFAPTLVGGLTEVCPEGPWIPDEDISDGCAYTCDSADADGCDDAIDCTIDSCDPAIGCVHLPDALACDDELPCTQDSCDPSTGCVNEATPGSCDDEDPCTAIDVCQDGVCTGSGEPDCDDLNLCTYDYCDSSLGCLNLASNDGGACDDLDACTTGDTCQAGECAGPGVLNCDDQEECTQDDCDPLSGCFYAHKGGVCDDGDACTTIDVCKDSQCDGSGELACDDETDCTDNLCDSALGCQYSLSVDETACDDDDVCTTGEACQGGACTPTGSLYCDDGDVCTDDSCDPETGCFTTFNTAPCEDGNSCTGNDTCDAGSCVPGPWPCDDLNPCTIDDCDSATGCAYVPDNEAACGILAQTTGTECSEGACVPTGCSEGYADADGDPATGCEAQIRWVDATSTATPADGSEVFPYTTLTEGLTGALSVSGPVLLRVLAGLYEETVVIDIHGLTIEGDGDGTLISVAAGETAVQVRAGDVRLRKLAVTGGRYGIHVASEGGGTLAGVEISNVSVTDCTGGPDEEAVGVWVQDAQDLSITDLTIDAISGGDGVVGTPDDDVGFPGGQAVGLRLQSVDGFTVHTLTVTEVRGGDGEPDTTAVPVGGDATGVHVEGSPNGTVDWALVDGVTAGDGPSDGGKYEPDKAGPGGHGRGLYVLASDGLAIGASTVNAIHGGHAGALAYLKAESGGGASGIWIDASDSGQLIGTQVNDIVGGDGGLGAHGGDYSVGGYGGRAVGVGFAAESGDWTLASNTIEGLEGGQGAEHNPNPATYPAGAGHDGGAYAIYLEEGAMAQQIAQDNTAEGDAIVYLYGADGVTVEGLALNADVNPTNWGKIAVIDSENVIVRNNTVSQFRAAGGTSKLGLHVTHIAYGEPGDAARGIYLEQCVTCQVADNTIEQVHSGAAGHDMSVPHVSGGRAAGIWLESSPGATVHQNTIGVVTAGAGGSGGNSQQWTNPGGEAAGIYLASSDDGTITGNLLAQITGGEGGGLTQGSLYGGGQGGRAAGVQLVASSDTGVTGNTVTAVTGGAGPLYHSSHTGGTGPTPGGNAAGVSLESESIGCTLASNVFDDIAGGDAPDYGHLPSADSVGFGLFMTADSQANTVPWEGDEANTLAGETIFYLYDPPDGTIIEDQTLVAAVSPTNWGKIAVLHASAVEVRNNTLVGFVGATRHDRLARDLAAQPGAGVLLHDCQSCIVTGNTISQVVGGHAGKLEAMDQYTAPPSFEGGEVVGGVGAGVLLTESDDAQVSDNVITGITGGHGGKPFHQSTQSTSGGAAAGVYLEDCQGGSLSNNTVTSVTGGTGGFTTGWYVGWYSGSGGVGAAVIVAGCSGTLIDGNHGTTLSGGEGGTGWAEIAGGAGGPGAGIWFAEQTSGVTLTDSVFLNVSGGAGGGIDTNGPGNLGPESVGFGAILEADSLSNTLPIEPDTWNTIEGEPIVYLHGVDGVEVSGLSVGAEGTGTNWGQIVAIDSQNVTIEGNEILGGHAVPGPTTPNQSGEGWFGDPGEDAIGVRLWRCDGCSVTSNTVHGLRGGHGGLGDSGGPGGAAVGVSLDDCNGSQVSANTVYDIEGGPGGFSMEFQQLLAGEGGLAAGVRLQVTPAGSSLGCNVWGNESHDIRGGSPGAEGAPGVGGAAIGEVIQGVVQATVHHSVIHTITGGGSGEYAGWSACQVFGGAVLASASFLSCQGVGADGTDNGHGVRVTADGTQMTIYGAIVSQTSGTCLKTDGTPASFSAIRSTLHDCGSPDTLACIDCQTEDPQFVSLSAPVDLHLQPTSPAIDSGHPGDGTHGLCSDEPEPNGCRVNMGAYGGTAEATSAEGDDTHCPIVCDSGVCTEDSECDDGDPCTDDSCEPITGCTATDNTEPCDDSDVCTTSDTCEAGTCVGGPSPCDDLNPCTLDSCDAATGCDNDPDDTAVCDPPLNATSGACSGGVCVPDACETGYASADGDPVTGCEAAIRWVDAASSALLPDGTQAFPYPTIGAGLEAVATAVGPVLLHAVAGIYAEAVVIDIEGLTLQGDGDQTILSAAAGETAVQVRASGVQLRQLAVTGGRYGIHVASEDGGTLAGVGLASVSVADCAGGPDEEAVGVWVQDAQDLSITYLSIDAISGGDGEVGAPDDDDGFAGGQAVGLRLQGVDGFTVNTVTVTDVHGGDGEPDLSVTPDGGDATGVHVESSPDGILSWLTIDEITAGDGPSDGGYGDQSKAGSGGHARGLHVLDSDGLTVGLVGTSEVTAVRGGHAGNSYPYACMGGDASGVAITGSDVGQLTSVHVSGITGGDGGVGGYEPGHGGWGSGHGGYAHGISFAEYSTGWTVESNTIVDLQGGEGGAANPYPETIPDSAGNPGAAYAIYLAEDAMAQQIADSNTAEGQAIVYVYGADNETIEGHLLDAAINPTNWGKIAVIESDNVTVTGNTVSHFDGGDGIIIITHSMFGQPGDAGRGIYLQGCTDCDVTLNTVTEIQSGKAGADNGTAQVSGGRAAGIWLESSQGALVEGNTVSVIGAGTGAACSSSTTNPGGEAAGIYLSDSGDGEVRSNIISEVTGGEGGGRRVHCYVGSGQGGRAAGVQLVASSDTTVDDNTVTLVTGGASPTQANAYHASHVRSVLPAGGNAAGIVLEANTTDCTLTSNEIADVVGGDSPERDTFNVAGVDGVGFGLFLTVDSQANTVLWQGDEVNTLEAEPIFYLYEPPAGTTIEGQTLVANGSPTNWGKIAVLHAQDIVISDNTLVNFQGPTGFDRPAKDLKAQAGAGIRLEHCANCTVTGNAISQIQGGHAGQNETRLGEEFIGALGAGVYLVESDGAQVSGNDVSNVTGGQGGGQASGLLDAADGGVAAGFYLQGCEGGTLLDNTALGVTGGTGGHFPDNGGYLGKFGGSGGLGAAVVVAGGEGTDITRTEGTTISGGPGGAHSVDGAGGAGGRGAGAWFVDGSDSVTLGQSVFLNIQGGPGGEPTTNPSTTTGHDNIGYGVILEADSLDNVLPHDALNRNTIEGDPVVYLYGAADAEVTGLTFGTIANGTNWGQIAVIDSTGVTVSGNELLGVRASPGATNSFFTNVYTEPGGPGDDALGIRLWGCDACSVTGNTVHGARGGQGGHGDSGGTGGAAVGITLDDCASTEASQNIVYDIEGGEGGPASQGGFQNEQDGPGGEGVGIRLRVTQGGSSVGCTVSGNEVYQIRGGTPGESAQATPAPGGDATGAAVLGAIQASMHHNVIHTITGGGSGEYAGASACQVFSAVVLATASHLSCHDVGVDGTDNGHGVRVTEDGTSLEIDSAIISKTSGACLATDGTPSLFGAAWSTLHDCGSPDTLTCTECLTDDPQFVSTAAPVDLHLQATSPAIDAGHPGDVDDVALGLCIDEPEPNGCRVNMGAYGGTVDATSADGDTHCPVCPAP